MEIDEEYVYVSTGNNFSNYRKKLEAFKNLVCTQEGYFFFDNYYIEKMCALEHKCNILENGGLETAISVEKTNKIFAFFAKIKNIFFKRESNIEY